MSKNGDPSANQFQIYEICRALYKNEQFFLNCMKNEEYNGFLIEKKLIDKIKKEIEYEKLKPLLAESDESFSKMKYKIKERKEKIKEISPNKFNNSSELIKGLNDEKSFHIIRQMYANKIIGDVNKSEGKEIRFKFDKYNIIIIFDDNDKLFFYKEITFLLYQN